MSWAGPPTNVSRTSPPTVARASISVFARCSDSRIRKSSIYYSFCSYVLKPVCNWTWSYDYYAQPPPQHPMYGLQQGPPGQSRQQMQPASHPGQHMQRPPNQQMQYYFWKVCLVLIDLEHFTLTWLFCKSLKRCKSRTAAVHAANAAPADVFLRVRPAWPAWPGPTWLSTATGPGPLVNAWTSCTRARSICYGRDILVRVWLYDYDFFFRNNAGQWVPDETQFY